MTSPNVTRCTGITLGSSAVLARCTAYIAAQLAAFLHFLWFNCLRLHWDRHFARLDGRIISNLHRAQSAAARHATDI